MTEENCRAKGHKNWQKRVSIGGKKVWCDPAMIPLLRALNNAGLVTRSHCVGHKTGVSWVAIRSNNIVRVEVRNEGEYKEVLVSWRKHVTTPNERNV